MTKTNVLGAMVLIFQDISVWSGKARFDRETDAVAAAGELPPKKLLSDGELNIVDPKHLNGLISRRSAVVRILERHGIRFTGGALIRKDKADLVLAEVAEEEKAFNEALDSLINNLPAYYAEQEKAFPQHVGLMAKYRVSESIVRSRCNWRVTAMAIGQPESDAAAATYAKAEGSVKQAMLEGIARDAKGMLRNFVGRQTIGQRGLNCVREIVGKLDAYSFLDPSIFAAVERFQALLKTFPKTGEISPDQTGKVTAMLIRMENPDWLSDEPARDTTPAEPEQAAPATTQPEQEQIPLAEPTTTFIPPAPAPAWGGQAVVL